MKSAGASLNTHIAGEVTTLARLWKITRTDGEIFAFTDHDQALTVAGTEYNPMSFTADAFRSGGNLDSSVTSFEAIINDDSITDADLRAHKFDYAFFEARLVNWADTSQGVIKLSSGRWGVVQLKEHCYEVELMGKADQLKRVVGWTYQPTCRVDLGDPATCKFDIDSVTQSGDVDSTANNRTIIANGITAADGYFDGGLLTWTSGGNSGLSCEVKTWTSSGSVIVLYLKTLLDIQSGDAFDLRPGCDKTIATCQTKFSNAINFHGEPYVPGVDWYLTYPDWKLPG